MISKKDKIPKTIHYCWFGDNELGEKEKKCIDSWKKIMPDYQIKRWDETNYDTGKCEFIKQARKHKKWAFISDYVRLDIIYNYGGIYLDTDVEVLKSFDDLLSNEAFFGFESNNYIANGLGFGAQKGNTIIKQNLEYYNSLNFDVNDLNYISCPKITTEVLLRHGLVLNNQYQRLDFASIFPKDYFCPLDYYTGKLNITNNTYSIHHYSMTWMSNRDKRWKNFNQKLSKVFGVKFSFIVTEILKFPGSFIIKAKGIGFKRTIRYYLMILRRY